jgi:predicted RNA binding protein YcfA (HicA-like mRNA interferase family)
MTDNRLVPVSGKQMVKAFQKIGYSVVRQKGSHIIMEKGEDILVIPSHNPVARGTVREFNQLLKK